MATEALAAEKAQAPATPPAAPPPAPVHPAPPAPAAPPPPTAQVAAPPPPAPAPRPSPFKLLSAATGAPPLKALIYGNYGVGKSTFGGSTADVPAMRDVLFIDAEAGRSSISNRPEIDVVSVNTYQTMDGIKEYLIRHCQARDSGNIDALRKLEEWVRGEPVETPKQYRTIVIDSISELYRLLMYNLLGVKAGETNLDLQMDNPEFSHWNQASSRIELLIRTFRDIPINVIFVCSAKEAEDERKQRIFSPNLPGKLANNIQGFLDVVGYLRVAHGADGAVKRQLALAPGINFNAKHRFAGVATTHLDNPTMAGLFALSQSAKRG